MVGIVLESVLIGIFVLLAAYSLFRCILWKKYSKAYLALTVAALIMALHTLITGETESLLSWISMPVRTRLEGLSRTLIGGMSLAYFYLYFPTVFRLKNRLVWGAFFVLECLALLVAPSFLLSILIPAGYVLNSLLFLDSGYRLMRRAKVPFSKAWSTLFYFTGAWWLVEWCLGAIGLLPFYTIPYLLALCALALIFLGVAQPAVALSESGLARQTENLRNKRLEIERQRGELEKLQRSLEKNEANFQKSRDALLELLTQREKEILERMVQGLSYREIAAQCFISEHTVNIHIQNIHKKLEVRNRAQLILLFSGKKHLKNQK